MTTNSPTLASTVVYCSVPDHRETQAITSLVATQYAFQLLELAALPDCDAATVSDLQAYLLCRQLGCPIPPRLNRLWETFFGRCESLVRRIIEQFCSRMQLSVEIDDLSQEVWHEIVEQLPKLVYDPTRGRLGDWLVGLMCRKLRRLLPSFAFDCQQLLDVELLDNIISAGPGPDEQCMLLEAHDHIQKSLGRFRQRVSSENYEIFHGRFVFGESFPVIASRLNMRLNEVQCRYYRLNRKWQRLSGHLLAEHIQ